jgi:hypothetical protein
MPTTGGVWKILQFTENRRYQTKNLIHPQKLHIFLNANMNLKYKNKSPNNFEYKEAAFMRCGNSEMEDTVHQYPCQLPQPQNIST